MWRFERSRFWLVVVPLAAACTAVAVILLDSDDGGDTTVQDSGAKGPPELPQPVEGQPDGGQGAQPSGPEDERRAIRAVRAYVDAVDDRDGARVCAKLAPGAIEGFELPREGGRCAASVSRSIGYRDPRGYPVFAGARIDAIGNVAIATDEARVTATIVTEFADRDQPSIEDDLVYLVEVGDEWRIAKPSAVLYRAVGRPDVPLEAVAPPG